MTTADEHKANIAAYRERMKALSGGCTPPTTPVATTDTTGTVDAQTTSQRTKTMTTTIENTPETNKAMIAAQERALRNALAGTREALTNAAKTTARQIVRAEKAIADAGLGLMWRFRDEGEAYAAVTFDYDRDVAPITLSVISEAYNASSAGSQKTWRAYAKLFFLAGVHGVETEETSISKIVDAFRDQLKIDGAISETGKGKGGGRKPRPSTVKDDKATTATPTTTPVATTDAVDPSVTAEPSIPAVVKPGKAYTVEVRRNAALILSGTPALSQDIVQAFEVHREQVLKFIRGLIESDKALKA